MRVAINGSRGFPDAPRAVNAYIDELVAAYGERLVLCSGGALGVDTVAENRARADGIQFEKFSADWDRHGKAAGKIRNWPLVNADRLVSFWDGWSNGTAHGVAAARAQFVDTEIVLPRNWRMPA